MESQIKNHSEHQNDGVKAIHLQLDHRRNLDSDSVGDGKVALLKQSSGHAAVLEHCIAVLHQLVRLFYLDGILEIQTIRDQFEKERHR